MAKKPKQEVGARNTPVWGLNLMRRDMLASLMDDLIMCEQQGIHESHCQAVKRALAQLVNQSSAIPDAPIFRSTIWEIFQEFEELYGHWNDVSGSHEGAQQSRRDHIRSLRRTRHRLAVRVRTNMHILDNELDLQLIDSMYAGFTALIKEVPQSFPKVAEAVARYLDRRAEATV